MLGAGGHALVCVEALEDEQGTVVVGTVAPAPPLAGLGLPRWLGADGDLTEIAAREGAPFFFAAIGDNRRRSMAFRAAVAAGLEPVNAVSRYARLSRSASVAAGTLAMAGATLNALVRVGEGSIVNTGALVDHESVLGAYCHVGPGAVLGGSVTVGTGAFIGLGARILPGLTIGERAMVGAGAVVTSDVPPDVTVVGVPARAVRPHTSQSM